jgi:uncharacterized protein
MGEVPDETIAWVVRFHGVVDELAAPIARAHRDALSCHAGCSGCCEDDLTVFELEAAVIAARHGELLREGAPHGPGACAFLDARGRCRVYEDRPYVCRTQGLPLRWLEHDADGEPVEARDVCPLNLAGVPLEELPETSLWTLGPIEQRLAAQQAALDGGEGRRIALRSLFADGGAHRRRLPIVG